MVNNMASLPQTPKKTHAVLVPFPTQGHINPLLKLSKLLHHRGFQITFVNTDYNHKRLLKSKGPAFLENLPDDFRFETIPDGLPPPDTDDATQDLAVLNDSTGKNCLAPFRKLLERLNNNNNCAAAVSCIVSDGMMSFTLQASQELGIPNVMFWTFGACGFMGFKLLVDLFQRGIIPFKDSSYLTDGTLDGPVDWLPGLKTFQLKHIPALPTNPNDLLLEILKGELEATSKASSIILHTFDALELQTLEALSPFFPPIYTVGPLQLLVDQIDPDKRLESVDCSLWKQQHECVEWLNNNEPSSVLYVNFGSVAILTDSEIVELAWGLVHSKKRFLWIIRPDLIKNGLLPSGFTEETKETGFIVGWCPQEKVLGHTSVGGFLTHCGWNSTIEGIVGGVPILCMPFLSEQSTNCKFVCDEWGVGLEIARNSGRDEIVRMAKKLMDGEEGKGIKKRAMELRGKARDATNGPQGSSFFNLEKLVNEVLIS